MDASLVLDVTYVEECQGLGVLAIVAAIAYTMGSKPYGYVGLGDVSVFIFFGLLGVAGISSVFWCVLWFDVVMAGVGCC